MFYEQLYGSQVGHKSTDTVNGFLMNLKLPEASEEKREALSHFYPGYMNSVSTAT